MVRRVVASRLRNQMCIRLGKMVEVVLVVWELETAKREASRRDALDASSLMRGVGLMWSELLRLVDRVTLCVVIRDFLPKPFGISEVSSFHWYFRELCKAHIVVT